VRLTHPVLESADPGLERCTLFVTPEKWPSYFLSIDRSSIRWVEALTPWFVLMAND